MSRTISGCAGTTGIKYGLRRHFRFLHPQDLVDVPGESLLTHGAIAVNASEPVSHRSPGDEEMQDHARFIQGHARSCKVMQDHARSCKVIQVMHVAKLQRKSVSNSAAALGHKFFAYGEELD